jgi:hypothetical protein
LQLLVLLVVTPLFAQLLPEEPKAKLGPLPTGVILIKGAEPSASDSVTPLPENGKLAENVYTNRYFGLAYALPAGWSQQPQGPPPSDSGAYVLMLAGAQGQGSVMLTAQDLFFGLTPSGSPMQMIGYSREHLPSYYEVERPPVEVKIANHTFARFDYTSSVAGLHWYVLATEARCHLVKIVFTGRDPKVLESLVQDMERMKLPDESQSPACVADYALGDKVTWKVAPGAFEKRYNAIPVRMIIGKNGKVKHVHVLSAFPDQARSITDALLQWRFKERDTEVETGMMFGVTRERPTFATPATVASAGSQ